MPQQSHFLRIRSETDDSKLHLLDSLPNWRAHPYPRRERSRGRHPSPPALLEWTEITGRVAGRPRSVGFYDIAPIVAYALLSLVFFAVTISAIVNVQGRYSVVMFVASVGLALMAAGKAIELRWELGR
jgi:hypothetical protein